MKYFVILYIGQTFQNKIYIAKSYGVTLVDFESLYKPTMVEILISTCTQMGKHLKVTVTQTGYSWFRLRLDFDLSHNHHIVQ